MVRVGGFSVLMKGNDFCQEVVPVFLDFLYNILGNDLIHPTGVL